MLYSATDPAFTEVSIAQGILHGGVGIGDGVAHVAEAAVAARHVIQAAARTMARRKSVNTWFG